MRPTPKLSPRCVRAVLAYRDALNKQNKAVDKVEKLTTFAELERETFSSEAAALVERRLDELHTELLEGWEGAK